jgi:hypothetical protein
MSSISTPEGVDGGSSNHFQAAANSGSKSISTKFQDEKIPKIWTTAAVKQEQKAQFKITVHSVYVGWIVDDEAEGCCAQNKS